jgi:alkylated DNA repair dioxygenase AlkB
MTNASTSDIAWVRPQEEQKKRLKRLGNKFNPIHISGTLANLLRRKQITNTPNVCIEPFTLTKTGDHDDKTDQTVVQTKTVAHDHKSDQTAVQTKTEPFTLTKTGAHDDKTDQTIVQTKTVVHDDKHDQTAVQTKTEPFTLTKTGDHDDKTDKTDQTVVQTKTVARDDKFDQTAQTKTVAHDDKPDQTVVWEILPLSTSNTLTVTQIGPAKQMVKMSVHEVLPLTGSTRRVDLTTDGSSWLEVSMLPDSLIALGQETFNRMWEQHPAARGKVVMYDQKQVDSHRWHASYLSTPARNPELKHSYMFAGIDDSHIRDPLPVEFQPFFDHFKNANAYNQVTANWYDGGDDYIAMHSDCEVGMSPNHSIALLTFNQDDSFIRKLIVQPRNSSKHKSIHPTIHVSLPTGSIVIMAGKCQAEFRHGVPPTKHTLHPLTSTTHKRISLSLRQFDTPTAPTTTQNATSLAT